ncbi:hypothetical protein FSP39_020976 [Pinctada imbricata]|uniref:Actin n=1 Tax=Pinctada imbricata TaxID=66713 RepID=A0AA88XJP1_PINIB|nr:hypothetical protein FSP39_020976 [Pinctada imbricata]
MSSSSSDGNYELPDGTVVTLESERFRCPEGMFKPSLIDKNVPGIHEMLYNSIMKCDADQRQALFGNIVLTGSTTSLPGFEQRFSAEIAHLAPSTMKVKVMALPSRDDLAWNGGSKLASEPTFRKMLITRKDYEEFGPSLIN